MLRSRMLALLLAVVMLLTACGGGKTPTETTAPEATSGSSSAETTTAATTESTTVPELKIERYVIITPFDEVGALYWNASSYLADAIDAITGNYPDMVTDIVYKAENYPDTVGRIYLGSTKFDISAELEGKLINPIDYAYKVTGPAEIVIVGGNDAATDKASRKFCLEVLGYEKGGPIPESLELTTVEKVCNTDLAIDLSGYQPVVMDEFDGDEINLDVWEPRGDGRRGCAYLCLESQGRVENGNCILSFEYRQDGKYGEGWYSAFMRLNERYRYGYYEIRAICNDMIPSNFWSAFWIQGHHPYDELSLGGIGSAEIDILEGGITPQGAPAMRTGVHCFGYADGRSSAGLRSSPVLNTDLPTCFTDYHVYGFEWTEEEYRFFLDGECIYELVWADGVSTDFSEVILSLCPPNEAPEDKTITGEFVIDYFRFWQKPEHIVE